MSFRWESVPIQPRCRWFVKRGAETRFYRGFRSKADAGSWIDSFGSAVQWRVGFRFKLKGDDFEVQIVDRRGVEAQP